jgi:uncharacterized protein (TIGR00159 family)
MNCWYYTWKCFIIFEKILNKLDLLFIHIRILDLVDIFLVGVLLFTFYKLLKGTAAVNILLGVIAVFVLWKITFALKMEMLSDILGAFFSVGIIALIVIFQPEIRQFLLELGNPGFLAKYNVKFKSLNKFFRYKIDLDIDPIVKACQRMSEIKQGALIVITRENELLQYVQTGELINSDINATLIENIFFKNSPLHDGAMIITGNKIKAAGCILPITKKKVSHHAGLRHRAAIGITEISDAIAIVVSEETGKISFSVRGEIRYGIQPATLQQKLVLELGLSGENQKN